MTAPEPLLLSVLQAAERLNVGRDACWRLVHEGRLRTVRIGRRYYVPPAELERFIVREVGGDGAPAH